MSDRQTYEDHIAHAEMMEEVARKVRAFYVATHRDPGSQSAHDARCAAALVIHYGGNLAAAMDAALPMLAEAA